MNTKILILVRSVPPFITNRRDVDYINTHLITLGYEIHVYDMKQKILINVNTNERINYNFFPKWIYISKIYLLLNFLVLLKFCTNNKGKYDIIQINYIREEFLLMPNLIKGLGNKLFLFIYGNDINERNFIKNNFTKLYDLSNKILCTNKKIGLNALNKINKNNLIGKIYEILIPLDHLTLYEDNSYVDKENFKKKLNIPKDKKTIIIGSNGTENEQHELIINHLANLKKIENYFFIIPMAISGDLNSKRIKEIKNMIQDRLITNNVLFIDDFISYEDVRDYRFAADILLNFRKKDQLAASMIESNMAYCQVITASWLPYENYTSKVKIEVIDTIDQLNSTIEKVYCDKELKEKLAFNKETILKNYHYNIVNNWVDLYNYK